MANQYLIQIHDYISAKIGDAQEAKKIAAQNNDRARISYLDGQIDELGALRGFLRANFDLPTQSYY